MSTDNNFFADLNELGVHRVLSGATIYAGCSSDSGNGGNPAYVVMALREDHFRSIMRASKACIENPDWKTIVFKDIWPARDQKDINAGAVEMSIDEWSLNVEANVMFWTGSDEYTPGDYVTGQRVHLPTLIRALNTEAGSKDMPAGAAWMGDALIYAEDAERLQELVDTLSEEIPEIEAHATAAQMDAVIGDAIGDAPAAAAPARRVRHGF
ncbi:outer membrane murein-binding lipoprotein Lpp [Roseateles asaccharophilus]|uniref:hypothetical protein n=1 Tax=Roseateles asaccharophilus TaxID=582607 RepID=UPI0038347ACD